MKALFLFPPNWCYSHPYLSIPCIIPYVKKEKIDVTVLDLNIICHKYFKSERFLIKCLHKICNSINQNLIKKYEMIYEFLRENADNVEDILRDHNKFLNYEKYIFAKFYEEELNIFKNVAYNPYNELENYKTVEDILKLTIDKDINYYIDFYEDIKEKYIKQDIDTIVISLAGTQQLVSTFTLCRLIKELFPHIKIILGGNPFTKIINKIDNSWKIMFQKLFDYILVYEGEYVVKDLLNCLEEQADICKIPNCIHLHKGQVTINNLDNRIVDIENAYIPDFRDYNLSMYSTPYVILPYYIERGCYWKRCTFCDHDFGFVDCYRIKSVDKVVKDLMEYKKVYNASYIHFVDEAIPPKFIEKMCNKFIENNLNIKWFTCIKASKKYTKELCDLMKKAGCVFVSIGIESCCQSVLDKMDKGIDIIDIETTLTNMYKSQIWAHSFMINNFEGEDYKNKWETFLYIYQHKAIFPSIGMGNFTLSKNAKIYDKIKLSEENMSMHAFSNNLVYTSDFAFNKEQSKILFKAYGNLNFTSYFFGRYIFEREHLAIFMENKNGFLNSQYLSKEVNNIIQYNKNYIITKQEKNRIYVYSLLNRKFYALPIQFQEILDKFDGDINSLLKENCISIFNNKNEIIRFFIEELYNENS